MMCIWAMGLIPWMGISFGFGIPEYSTSVNFNPSFILFVINLIGWFLPLLGILIFSITIIRLFHLRRKKQKRFHSLKVQITMQTAALTDLNSLNILTKKVRFSSQTKYIIIMTTYWFQWTPPCIFLMANSICNCISNDLISSVYWLTYSVCLTDPLVVLLLNPNVSFSTSSRKFIK